MPTITVKNIPPEIYTRLKRSAQANHRSINSEIIACIERAVASQSLDPGVILDTARSLREKTANYLVTDEELTQAKNAGRS
jgi:plasmid stability protein